MPQAQDGGFWRALSSLAAMCAAEFRVSRTCHEVIVDHARRLHQRVADRRTDKLESALQQIAAHRVGFGCARGDVCHVSPAILNWLPADETPQVGVEALHFFPQPRNAFAFSIVATIFSRLRTIPVLPSSRCRSRLP